MNNESVCKHEVRRTKDIVQREYLVCLRNARIAILVVSALFFLSALIFYVFRGSHFAALVPSVKNTYISFDVILGLICIGLFFWAKKNVFAASMTAMILYIMEIAIWAAINPMPLLMTFGITGIAIRIAILFSLGSSLRFGLAYARYLKKQRVEAE